MTNPYVGNWRLLSATVHQNGESASPFGERPSGMLTFTADLRFIEVLLDPDLPRFASDEIGAGTDEENRAAAARTIGIFGTYEVDADGGFAGDRVEGCTFPNWIGDVRTHKDITVAVAGDRMTETFHRPDGSTIELAWERAGTAP